MKHEILLMLLLFPCAAIGQPEKQMRRLTAIGIVASPDFSYRTLKFASSNSWIEERRNREEIGNYGFTAGFVMDFRLHKKVKVESGLLFSNKGLKTKFEDLVWASGDPLMPAKSKTIYRFKYLTLPANFHYSFPTRKKVGLFVTAGISANIFLVKKTKVALHYTNGNSDEHASSRQTGYSKFNLAVSVGAGVEYQPLNRIIIRTAPFYQRFLNSIVVDNAAKEYLFSFGVSTGVHYVL